MTSKIPTHLLKKTHAVIQAAIETLNGKITETALMTYWANGNNLHISQHMFTKREIALIAEVADMYRLDWYISVSGVYPVICLWIQIVKS